ncbi:MAG: hypothetical protein JKY31_01770 [Rhodobacteraceae bacterium]|nr:hypothetical protein [Paracoccaceae bacterium]
MAEQFIKIFGERNTGTRAITLMLQELPHITTRLPVNRMAPELAALRNRVKDRQYGHWVELYLDAIKDQHEQTLQGIGDWKHTAPVFDQSYVGANAKILFAVRNPYSWLLSLAKRPYHIRGKICTTLEQFVDLPWLTLRRDHLDGVLISPMSLWTEKLRAYSVFLKSSSQPSEWITFEAFIVDPVAILGGALTRLDVSSEGLVASEESTKPGQVPLPKIQEKYLTEEWKNLLSRQTVALINDLTDWDVAAEFGYEKFDPRDFPINLSDDINKRIFGFLQKGSPRKAPKKG